MDAIPSDFPSDPSASSNMPSVRRWARKLERSCWACAKYFPLAFVYGLTTWAVFVLVNLCSSPSKVSWHGTLILTVSFFPSPV
jgi:palmitoyltransferase